MKKLKFKWAILILCVLVIQGCVLNGQKMKSFSDMTPKERVIMAYSAYNSQFSSYMTTTGWIMNIEENKWEKLTIPDLSEDQKNVLRKKKEILTKLWPLIKIYDNMTMGVYPYSAETERELFTLIDALADLVH